MDDTLKAYLAGWQAVAEIERQDLADIQAIAASQSDLDIGRIQLWVEQFGTALGIPDLYGIIYQLL